MNSLRFCIPFLLLAIKHESNNRNKCRKLSASIPAIESCPSFDFIASNTMNGSISLFCRKYVHKLCLQEFDSDPAFQKMWENVMCTKNFQKIDTKNGMGLKIREIISHELFLRCEPYQTPMSGIVPRLTFRPKTKNN